MEIKEVEKRIMKFVKMRTETKGFDLTPEQSYIHLMEEMGEVARQLSNKKMRPEMFDEENFREEIVDVILESIILANSCGIDIENEMKKKLATLFKRHGFSDEL